VILNILVLNGSPRPGGNTSAMVHAFADGAILKGHTVTIIDVCRKKIQGCLGCEHCHRSGHGECIQKDDMQEVYQALETAEMIVIATPIYYFGFSGQLQCAIHRTYAIGIPKNLRKAMLILSSGGYNVFDGAIYEYKKTFMEYMGLQDIGIYKAYGSQNKTEKLLSRLRQAGEEL
jgi:multimeric flavodoxin WrbA